MLRKHAGGFTGMGTAMGGVGAYQVGKRTFGGVKHIVQTTRGGVRTKNPYYSDTTGKLLKNSSMDKLAEDIYGISALEVPYTLGKYNLKNNRRI